jgi:hypothetical protein
MAICFFFVITRPAVTVNPAPVEEQLVEKVKLSGSRKANLLLQLLPYMTPLFVVYFGEYLINQGISSGNFENVVFSDFQ